MGREEEGSSSNRPELAAFFLALRDTLIEEPLLFFCVTARGLFAIRLEEGSKIEVPLKNKHGKSRWVKCRVSSTTAGSLEFTSRIRGYLDHGDGIQTLNRADMGSTWRLPRDTRLGQRGEAATLSIQGFTPWHHSSHGSHSVSRANMLT